MDAKRDLKFTLYRIQIFLPNQLSLLEPQKDPKDILQLAFEEKPTIRGAASSWHIGNILQANGKGIYFAVGKKLPKRDDKLDEISGDFYSEAHDIAPYTHAILDLKYQVVAIAHNPELAADTKSVAGRLEQLLQHTNSVSLQSGVVSVDLIKDPTEFLTALNEAYSVTRFQVSYGYPNVWDAESDFQKPFQETARTVGSDEASAVFTSKSDLKRLPLEKLTRAAAAVGKKVKATIKRFKNQQPVSMSLKNNPAKISTDPPSQSQDMRWALETIDLVRTTYEDIRERE